MYIVSETRECVADNGHKKWLYHEWTGRIGLEIWGFALPMANRRGLVGRFYWFVYDMAVRWHLWRRKGE